MFGRGGSFVNCSLLRLSGVRGRARMGDSRLRLLDLLSKVAPGRNSDDSLDGSSRAFEVKHSGLHGGITRVYMARE